MKLVVGLGNPGKEYAQTRHNAGFLAVDLLADHLQISWSEDVSLHAWVAKVTHVEERLILAKPTTFMNHSGEAVHALMTFYKIPTSNILIVQDELDLAPGRMAFLEKGGPAGHNGIISIHERINTQEIARLRIGIGRAMHPQTTESWVLGPIEPTTIETTKNAPQAILDWVQYGLSQAMNRWNRK